MIFEASMTSHFFNSGDRAAAPPPLSVFTCDLLVRIEKRSVIINWFPYAVKVAVGNNVDFSLLSTSFLDKSSCTYPCESFVSCSCNAAPQEMPQEMAEANVCCVTETHQWWPSLAKLSMANGSNGAMRRRGGRPCAMALHPQQSVIPIPFHVEYRGAFGWQPCPPLAIVRFDGWRDPEVLGAAKRQRSMGLEACRLN